MLQGLLSLDTPRPVLEEKEEEEVETNSIIIMTRTDTQQTPPHSIPFRSAAPHRLQRRRILFPSLPLPSFRHLLPPAHFPPPARPLEQTVQTTTTRQPSQQPRKQPTPRASPPPPLPIHIPPLRRRALLIVHLLLLSLLPILILPILRLAVLRLSVLLSSAGSVLAGPGAGVLLLLRDDGALVVVVV